MKDRLKACFAKDNKIICRCCQKVLLWYFLTGSCFAQNPHIDQLIERLGQHPANDFSRARILMELVETYNAVNKDSMFHYCKLMLTEARQTNHPIQMAQANKAMGLYWQNIQPSESFDYFRQALEMYKSAGNREEVVNINNMIAITYYHMDEYDKELFYLKKALQDALELDNVKLEINILHNISEAYFHLDNFELAEEYSLMALQESRHHDNWMLDEIINAQAGIEFRKGNYQLSIELSKSGLARAQESGQTRVQIACMCNIAECLMAMKQYPEARTTLEKCQQMAKPDDVSYDYYKTLQLATTLDSVTGNFAAAFNKQRQLEQLIAKKHSLEQMQKTSEKALQAELQHLGMKLYYLQSTHQVQKKQVIKMNILFVFLVLVICGGCFFLFRFRRSFKNLKLENIRLKDEQVSVVEKKNGLWNKYHTLLEKKESLKKTNEELVVSNRSKTELFKAISHDLQTPLIRLQQSLGNLMVTDVGETQFRQATNELTNKVGDISLLLENLLQWSKFQSQGIHAKPQYTEMTALVNETINQQKFSAAEKKISTHNALKYNIFVYADEEMAKSSLRAILQNIVKLSEPNATITISGDKDKQNGWLQINYVGQMPLKQMFLQQSQADSYGSESSELGKAISLGWMLCRVLMAANQGDIQIEDISKESFSIVLHFPLEESISKVKV